MAQPRATAQQAIEVLKVHQLRKENAVIFEEVKHLRGEVTSRKTELNSVLKQVADLKAQLNQIVDRIGEHEDKLETLKVTTTSATTNIEGLRKDHEKATDDIVNKLEAREMAAQDTGTTELLREEIVQLRGQIADCDEKTATLIDDMNQDLNTKAEQQDVIELGDRLDQLIEDLDLRLKKHESVSRVADTVGQLVDHTSDVSLPRDNHYEDSMWKPIGAPIHTNDQQGDRAMATHTVRERVEAQPASAADAHAEVSPTRNMISNISHAVADQDEPPDTIAPPEITQQHTITEHSPSQHRNVPPLSEHRLARLRSQSLQEQLQQPRPTSEATRLALYAILRLEQGEKESLEQYLVRFEDIMAFIGVERSVVAICLKRFLKGARAKEQQHFVQEWLNTSEYSLQAARDCMIILTRCHLNAELEPESMPVVEPAAAQNLQADANKLAGRLGGETDVGSYRSHHHRNELQGEGMPQITADAHAGDNMPPARVKYKPCPNVVTRAAAISQKETPLKWQKNAGSKKGREHVHKKGVTCNACKIRRRQGCAKRQIQPGRIGKRRHTQSPAKRGVPLGIPMATSQVPRTTAAIDSYTAPQPIHGTVEDPVTSQQAPRDEEGIVDLPGVGEEASMPSSPPSRDESIPHRGSPRLGCGRLTGVPTLVNLVGPQSTVPETSDPIRLPPVKPQEPHRKEPRKMDQPAKRRKTRHDTPPEIPILSLSPSDFAM